MFSTATENLYSVCRAKIIPMLISPECTYAYYSKVFCNHFKSAWFYTLQVGLLVFHQDWRFTTRPPPESKYIVCAKRRAEKQVSMCKKSQEAVFLCKLLITGKKHHAGDVKLSYNNLI